VTNGQPKVTKTQAIAGRRPVAGRVNNPEAIAARKAKLDAEAAETLRQAQALEAQRMAEANPIRAECLKLGEELKLLGVPWHFGGTINTDFHTAVIAEAAIQLLTEDLGVPLERAQEVIFTILRGKMQQTIAAARTQKSQLIVPGAPEVPPDLLNFARKPSD
jgi:hypothetical protein